MFLLTTIGRCVPPSRYHAVLIGHGAAGGQSHGLDVAVEGGGATQLDQHDVVVQVVAVVIGVFDEFGSIDPLLSAFVHSNVVLTQTHLHTADKKRRINQYAKEPLLDPFSSMID